MLYTSTRNKNDAYTAQRALKEYRAPDGGFYAPAQIPIFSDEELRMLLQESVGGVMAQILNRFFNTKLTQWDVEFAVGKQLFGLREMSHRIVFGEAWRNMQGSFEELVLGLTELTSAEAGMVSAGPWMGVAVRIGLLFGIASQLNKDGMLGLEEPLDIALPTADLMAVSAACCARKMGLNIGTIVCCCNENSGVWDLICRGQMKLNAKVIPTSTPEYDMAVPGGLEMLLHILLGPEESCRFSRMVEQGGTYFLSAEQHRHFRAGLDACVVSERRLFGVIPNLYRTNGYVLCPYSALVYSGLMDYRSISRQRNLALIFVEQHPAEHLEQTARRLEIPESRLREEINRS